MRKLTSKKVKSSVYGHPVPGLPELSLNSGLSASGACAFYPPHKTEIRHKRQTDVEIGGGGRMLNTYLRQPIILAKELNQNTQKLLLLEY